MTEPTALARLRHLYQNMVNGGVRDTASAKRIAEGLLSPAIEALERGSPVVATKVSIPTDTLEQEFQNHYRRGFDAGKKVGTPQPTQAQAGAVPLTDEQRARIVLTANTVGEAINMVEHAHGIKGGQHGTE